MKKLPIIPVVLFAMLGVLHFLSAIFGFWKSPGFIQFELECAIVFLVITLIWFLESRLEKFE